MQREIVARSDLVDLRWHPKTWELLRHTRMPAIRLDAGYLTNPGDARRLRDPAFRDVLAEAIVVSVQRFYLSPEVDSSHRRTQDQRDPRQLPGRLMPQVAAEAWVPVDPDTAFAVSQTTG